MIGRVLGPCLIEEELGRGAMGVVYRAKHLTLDRPVAVKVLEGLSQRAIKEARTAAKLEDPRVVQVFDAGEADGLGYIVMQLVTGRTLASLIAERGPLSPAEARTLMKDVLGALAAAHAQSIVHRDVKPANIMVDEAGRPRLMDFGLAASSTASGTWDYMAPEQGFGAAPDPRMDLYSFGATWFFTLAGRPPFVTGQRADLLIMHRETPPPDVRQYAPKVTKAAAELIARLMAKDPERRPASAAEVLKLLDRHDMVLEVDASGSPFQLLPPPAEPERENAIFDVEQGGPAAVAPEDRSAPAAAPPPPPPPAMVPPSPWPARVLFAGLWLGLSGRHWLSPTSFDLVAAAALPWPWITGPALAAYGWLRGVMGFEAMVAGGLALVCLAASWVLRNRFLWAAALGIGLFALKDGLMGDYAVWTASGGWWRWLGVAAVVAWWLKRPKPAPGNKVAPPVTNWYRS